MQNLMSEFQKGLGSILRRQHGGIGGGNDGGSPQSDEGLASILTPIDEVQYWADMANTAGRRDLRQMAAAFHSCLEPLTGEVARLETLAQLQVSETFISFEGLSSALEELVQVTDVPGTSSFFGNCNWN